MKTKARLYVNKLADKAENGFDLNFTAVLTLTDTQFAVLSKFIHILDKALFGQGLVIQLGKPKDIAADDGEPTYDLDELHENQAL